MKVSKITIITCVILDIIIGAFIGLTYGKYTIARDLFYGVFTGIVVSIVMALINYFYEKSLIFSKAKNQLLDTYIDLLIIHQMTGSILGRVIYTPKLDDLNFRAVVSLSDIAVHSIDKSSLNAYSPFTKKGKWLKLILNADAFEDKLYNLKFCLNNIQKNVLDADILQLEKTLYVGVPFPKEAILVETRNLVNVQTAKVHEYEASLLQELDSLASEFYGDSWTERKSTLVSQATQILQMK